MKPICASFSTCAIPMRPIASASFKETLPDHGELSGKPYVPACLEWRSLQSSESASGQASVTRGLTRAVAPIKQSTRVRATLGDDATL